MDLTQIYDKLSGKGAAEAARPTGAPPEPAKASRSLGRVLGLRASFPGTTDRLDPNIGGAPIIRPDAELVPHADVEDYVRLPVVSARRTEDLDDVSWRIRLFVPQVDYEPLRLEIYDSVFVGREWEGIPPDLDLTRLAGRMLGVSRRHALLQPTEKRLDLIDLGSTNGTFLNGERLPSGVAHQLRDGDTIGFARLRFLVKIDGRPGS